MLTTRIIVLYWSLAWFLLNASFDPAKNKSLIGYSMWGANLAHGIVATVAVFTDQHQYGFADYTGSKLNVKNIDKLFIACPTWFTLFFVNLFFAKKVWGESLLPAFNGKNPLSLSALPETDNKMVRYYSYWLKLEANVYLGLPFVASRLASSRQALRFHWRLRISRQRKHRHIQSWLHTLEFVLEHDHHFILVARLFLLAASLDPPKHKALLGYSMWGSNFAHGIIATLAVFTDTNDYQYQKAIGGFRNLDKLFVAVPVWFGLFFINRYFAKAVFGEVLLPDRIFTSSSVQPAPESASPPAPAVADEAQAEPAAAKAVGAEPAKLAAGQ